VKHGLLRRAAIVCGWMLGEAFKVDPNGRDIALVVAVLSVDYAAEVLSARIGPGPFP
jgi:hypothetical protein